VGRVSGAAASVTADKLHARRMSCTRCDGREGGSDGRSACTTAKLHGGTDELGGGVCDGQAAHAMGELGGGVHDGRASCAMGELHGAMS